MLDDLLSLIERIAVLNYELGYLAGSQKAEEAMMAERDLCNTEARKIVEKLAQEPAS